MRKKPTLLIEVKIPGKPGSMLKITRADAVYAVYYDGAPINKFEENIFRDVNKFKYQRTSFSTPGQAMREAKKLNEIFDTDLFTCICLIDGLPVKKKV